MTNQTNMNSTPATRHHPSTLSRLSAGIGAFFGIGVFAALLMIIPPVGICLAVLAVFAPFYWVLKADSRDSLFGSCPHCSREIKVMWTKARKGGFNCRFCKRRIVLQGLLGDEHFLGV